MRIVGLIVTTFMVAIIYGLFVATMDFMSHRPDYSPVASGHRAADTIYGLFGTMNTEIKNNEGEAPSRGSGVAYKIAMPYAVTADLSAILGGKIESGIAAFIHRAPKPSIQPNTAPI